MEKTQRVIDHFMKICSIPHCSTDAKRLFDYLRDFASERGYSVESDEAGNIHIYRGDCDIVLQAHYDMVCTGSAPDIVPVRDGRYLKASASSLGADNGIAIAMMMELMNEGRDLNLLLTSDEEIGMVGASALSLDIGGKYLLNLDSEEEGVVYIGCAGGSDIVAVRDYHREMVEGDIYRISVSGLPGGHSGVDIDRDIPNAITTLAEYLRDLDPYLVSFDGGERRNSIPSSAEAVVVSRTTPRKRGGIDIEKISNARTEVVRESRNIFDFLSEAPHGVLRYDRDMDVVSMSVNLARVHISEGDSRIEYSLRAMDGEDLDMLEKSISSLLKCCGYDISVEGRYEPWRPRRGEFADYLLERLSARFGKSVPKAIHAGLECGIIGMKYPGMQMASIGPTIEYPHSDRERVDIESVGRVFEVLVDILDGFEKRGRRQI
jgi:dipeptidase D